MRDVSCINWWFTDCTRTCLPWSLHFQHHATSQKTPCSLHSSPTLFYTSQLSKMSCDSVVYKDKKNFIAWLHCDNFLWSFARWKEAASTKTIWSKIYPGTFPAPVHDSRHCFCLNQTVLCGFWHIWYTLRLLSDIFWHCFRHQIWHFWHPIHEACRKFWHPIWHIVS